MPLNRRDRVCSHILLLALVTCLPVAAVSGDQVAPTSGTAAVVGKVGRPVRVVSLSFREKTLDQVVRLVDQAAAPGADLIILPETWLGQKESPETLEGPTLAAIGLLAKKHHTYVICPIDRREGTRRLNSAVLLDRQGQVQGAYPITGEELHYSKSQDVNIARLTLDLDRGIYHQNFNIDARDRLLREHANDVRQEKWLDREQWFVLAATRPGVSARALAKEYGLEELREYLSRSRREIDGKRGWPFASGGPVPASPP